MISTFSSVAVWTTCLRNILFCREDQWSQYSDLAEEGDQVLSGEAALTFLLEVLCGLHSPIIGETEVFGQFKKFVGSRKLENDSLFGDQQKWLHFVLTEVKKSRSELLSHTGSQSYGSLLRRYSKSYSSITFCGSGQLTQEILPWIQEKSVQVLCRNPLKDQEFFKALPAELLSYDQAYVHGQALVIAAPLSDQKILDLIHRQEINPRKIFDLRGEKNNLKSLIHAQCPQVSLMTLQDFFNEIEGCKKETEIRVQKLKDILSERAQSFIQRTELRPLGWDDLCA